MAAILLTTINAKYIHTAFGLRTLAAALAPLAGRATILEATDRDRPVDLAERILAEEPRVVGVGVYVWNAVGSRDLVAVLKRLRPDLLIVLGGPEVSYETEAQPIVAAADYVIRGEGEIAFRELCAALLAGDRPAQKIVDGSPPAMDDLALPYDLYDDEDIAHRTIYIETSRGCPYRCEFCLSALDERVRYWPLDRVLPAFDRLLARGATKLKLVDRTFNLATDHAAKVLEFFLDRQGPGSFLHCEMIPDRLPERLRGLIRRFPPGALQLEIGVQTLDRSVAARIQRNLDVEAVLETFTFLRRETGAHLHADLIVGLPGESIAGFAAGFDRLVGLEHAPQEIQVGILKRLRGAPISRHDAQWGMVYNPLPPYDLLYNDLIDFGAMQRCKRFALSWDTVQNRGNFRDTAPLLWRGQPPFAAFAAFCDWTFARVGRIHSIALDRLAGLMRDYLVDVRGLSASDVGDSLVRDYTRCGRTKIPSELRGRSRRKRAGELPARQARHARN